MSDDATIRARKAIRNALFLAGTQLVGAVLLTVSPDPLSAGAAAG